MKLPAALLAVLLVGCGSAGGKKAGDKCLVSSECGTGLVCDTIKMVCADNLSLRLDSAVRDAAALDGTVIDANMVDDARVIDAPMPDARPIDAMVDSGADASDAM